MIRVTTLVLAVVIAIPAAAQQPVQFKANVKTKNGNDGTTATGTRTCKRPCWARG